MNRDKEKKEKERNWLKLFQKLNSECPPYEPQEKESPDFVFPTDDLGIEIIEYYLGAGDDGSRFKQIESVHQRIVSKAQSIFESESNLKLQVTVFWGSSCPSKRNEKNISEALAREVLKQLSINSPMGRLNSPQFDEPILQYSLEGISYFSLGENGSSCWSSPLALFPGSATNRMQMVLDEKRAKIIELSKILFSSLASCGFQQALFHFRISTGKRFFGKLFQILI